MTWNGLLENNLSAVEVKWARTKKKLAYFGQPPPPPPLPIWLTPVLNHPQYCKQLYWLVNHLREKGNGDRFSELFAELRATLYVWIFVCIFLDNSRVPGDGDAERWHRLHRAQPHLPLTIQWHGTHASLWLLHALHRSAVDMQTWCSWQSLASSCCPQVSCWHVDMELMPVFGFFMHSTEQFYTCKLVFLHITFVFIV